MARNTRLYKHFGDVQRAASLPSALYGAKAHHHHPLSSWLSIKLLIGGWVSRRCLMMDQLTIQCITWPPLLFLFIYYCELDGWLKESTMSQSEIQIDYVQYHYFYLLLCWPPARPQQIHHYAGGMIGPEIQKTPGFIRVSVISSDPWPFNCLP